MRDLLEPGAGPFPSLEHAGIADCFSPSEHQADLEWAGNRAAFSASLGLSQRQNDHLKPTNSNQMIVIRTEEAEKVMNVMQMTTSFPLTFLAGF